jgi:hypothetical protein
MAVVEQSIPSAQLEAETHVAASGAMIGFPTKMTLDVALG